MKININILPLAVAEYLPASSTSGRFLFMKTIPLTQGKVALVDDDDYERLSQHKWFAVWDGYNWYASRKIRGTHPRKQLRMHNAVQTPPNGRKWDHKDRNGLNNQRSNLRPSTHRQNSRNKWYPSQNTSGFKGVSWKPRLHKWVAQIKLASTAQHHGVIYLGLFEDKTQAALAYDAAAIQHFGDFALTNAKLGLL